MSWDVFAQDLPPSITTLDEISDTFVPRSVGQRAAIIEKIRKVVPAADFAEPAWGKITLPDCEMEIGLGSTEKVESIAFHVHGGELSSGVIVAILRELKLRALDSATGELFDAATAADSFAKWLKYRDEIIKNSGA